MIDALSAAVSGLAVASKRILAGAQNTANASTINYTPIDVKSTALPIGGAKADFVPRDPAFIKAYQPDSDLADGEGYVNAPNVQLDQEAVGIAEASILYKANAAVIAKVNDLQDELIKALDTRA